MTITYSLSVNNAVNGFGLQFSDLNYSVELDTGEKSFITVPDANTFSPNVVSKTMYIAVFSYKTGSEAWVSLNEEAVPPVDTLELVNSTLNPSARYVTQGDEIHVTAGTDGATLSISLYTIS